MPWIATKSVPGVALSATTRKCDTVHHVSEAGGAHLLPCGGARDLQVHVIAVVRQVALLPEGDAGAVGARVVAPLQVHRIDVCRQAVLLPECDAGAVVARVVAQLQVHRIDVRLQVALLPGGDAGRGSRGTRGRVASSAPHRCESSGSASPQRRRRGSTAVGARVVAPLRVHRVEVPRQVALRLESDRPRSRGTRAPAPSRGRSCSATACCPPCRSGCCSAGTGGSAASRAPSCSAAPCRSSARRGCAAVGALVVAPHPARVPVAVLRRLKLGEAVRAGVRALARLGHSSHTRVPMI